MSSKECVVVESVNYTKYSVAKIYVKDRCRGEQEEKSLRRMIPWTTNKRSVSLGFYSFWSIVLGVEFIDQTNRI